MYCFLDSAERSDTRPRSCGMPALSAAVYITGRCVLWDTPLQMMRAIACFCGLGI